MIAKYAALAIAGCLSFAAPALSQTKNAVSVRTSFIYNGTNFAWFLGIERGYFAQENIELTVNEGRGSAITATSVASKADDFGMSDGASLILLRSKGASIKAVMSLRNSNAYDVLFLKGSGVKTIKDLEGKRIGYTAGDALAPQWNLVLDANNLDASKITLMHMDAGSRPVALMERRVDAILGSYIDQGKLIEGKGFEVERIAFADVGVNNVTSTVVAHEDLIKSNPDLVRRFVRAASKTWDAYKKEPQAAVAAAVKQLPRLNPDVSLQQAIGNASLMDSVNTKGKPVGFGSDSDWKSTVDQLKKLGSLTSNAPYTSYFTNEFVPQ